MFALLLTLALATTTTEPAEGFEWDSECGIDCVEPQDLWDAALGFRAKWQDCEDDRDEENAYRLALEAKLDVRTSTTINLIAAQAADRVIEAHENEGWSKSTWFWTGTTVGGIVTAAVITGIVVAFKK